MYLPPKRLGFPCFSFQIFYFKRTIQAFACELNMTHILFFYIYTYLSLSFSLYVSVSLPSLSLCLTLRFFILASYDQGMENCPPNSLNSLFPGSVSNKSLNLFCVVEVIGSCAFHLNIKWQPRSDFIWDAGGWREFQTPSARMVVTGRHKLDTDQTRSTRTSARVNKFPI